MAVNTKNKHWQCTKCGAVFQTYEHTKASKEACPNLGTHSLKIVQAHWDNSALGATVNLLGKGVKAGVNKAAEYNSEEARELREIKREQQEEKRKIQEAEQKVKDKELAVKSWKVYGVIKPYLKFIIPIYLVAFGVTLFLVKKKIVVAAFFGLPIVAVLYLGYNMIVNKEER